MLTSLLLWEFLFFAEFFFCTFRRDFPLPLIQNAFCFCNVVNWSFCLLSHKKSISSSNHLKHIECNDNSPIENCQQKIVLLQLLSGCFHKYLHYLLNGIERQLCCFIYLNDFEQMDRLWELKPRDSYLFLSFRSPSPFHLYLSLVRQTIYNKRTTNWWLILMNK